MVDGLLGVGLLWFAWQALNGEDLFRSIVYFICFGLLLALIWVRLNAPDIALAEAAIGAGLTGALMLNALARLNRASVTTIEQKPALFYRLLTGLCCLLIAAGLITGIYQLSAEFNLISLVNHSLSVSGVKNPVTAVLLNFRGYDTMLELAVLLVALLGVWSLDIEHQPIEDATPEVLNILSRLLTPMLILVAAYLLWVGADAPGGAFQAGSVLGAAGVLLVLSGWTLKPAHAGLPLRLVLVAGPTVFVGLSIYTLWYQSRLLQFPVDQAGSLLLLLETFATLSIAATLAALFYGVNPARTSSNETHNTKDSH